MNIQDVVYVFSQTIIITFLVIMMMMLIEYFHVKISGKLFDLMRKNSWTQVLISALIGLIPGCIGGFTIVSLYTHKVVGFGALLAALIASFGDEALFMFSFIPLKATMIAGILFVIAVIFGLLVNKLNIFEKNQTINSKHFELHTDNCLSHTVDSCKHYQFGWKRSILLICIILFIIAIPTQFIGHSHENESILFNHNTAMHNHTEEVCVHAEEEGFEIGGEQIVFLVISTAVLLLVLLANPHFVEAHLWNHVIKKHFLKIFLWTFFILIIIHFILNYNPIETIFGNAYAGIILLLFVLLIGFIPQSGPHLIVLFLFMQGLIPFSALLANSILQEGHAGLPLIAESPKSFISIKIIKFIIALAVGLSGFLIGF
ncbi:MAG: arsenic efflux protein [Bacteroidales bacterium]|nr:arsenic efflux protein [Bacteroidales bacterium]